MDLPADAAARDTQGEKGRGEEEEISALQSRIAAYYGDTLRRHGATPRGADWSCEPTQQLRFVQLLRLFEGAAPRSLNDVGCGWGALVPFLARRFRNARIDYLGSDVSADMVAQAQALWGHRRGVAFAVGGAGPRKADHAVASGIFNVRLGEPLPAWEAFVAHTLAELHRTTRRGFAVNFLRTLPAGVEATPQLYRTEPERWAAFCRKALGREVVVLADYGMREFTLLARA